MRGVKQILLATLLMTSISSFPAYVYATNDSVDIKTLKRKKERIEKIDYEQSVKKALMHFNRELKKELSKEVFTKTRNSDYNIISQSTPRYAPTDEKFSLRESFKPVEEEGVSLEGSIDAELTSTRKLKKIRAGARIGNLSVAGEYNPLNKRRIINVQGSLNKKTNIGVTLVDKDPKFNVNVDIGIAVTKFYYDPKNKHLNYNVQKNMNNLNLGFGQQHSPGRIVTVANLNYKLPQKLAVVDNIYINYTRNSFEKRSAQEKISMVAQKKIKFITFKGGIDTLYGPKGKTRVPYITGSVKHSF
ncbi:hypothetical protein AYK26_07545 [Euryarchaeota archaeon SM23-78]|nr:MAG: hypothetical protein AYK26_07545 [Euryarchaeota archaeon SM23-78]MBW3001348.1 hypothetical protein [Candidatus Woesearchaeota archaeon]